jgi:hypothetical protein
MCEINLTHTSFSIIFENAVNMEIGLLFEISSLLPYLKQGLTTTYFILKNKA